MKNDISVEVSNDPIRRIAVIHEFGGEAVGRLVPFGGRLRAFLQGVNVSESYREEELDRRLIGQFLVTAQMLGAVEFAAKPETPAGVASLDRIFGLEDRFGGKEVLKMNLEDAITVIETQAPDFVDFAGQ